MSRSIESRKALRRKGVRWEIGKKHDVKREERRAGPGTSFPVDPDTIPINVFDQGPYVHYPASPDDIRGVMRLLPPGSLDGVALIDCRLGEYDQPDATGDDADDLAPDPLVGRHGCEVLPGVFSGDILANYVHEDARIQLHALVYDRARLECQLWEVALRADALAVFAHEVAHHDDRTRRFARGRWIMQRKALNERYARGLEREWAEHYVLPYVRETYGGDVRALREWYRADGASVLADFHDSGCCSFCRLFEALAATP